MGAFWTLSKEAVLSESNPLIFLGIDIIMRPNGDLHQVLTRMGTADERFAAFATASAAVALRATHGRPLRSPVLR